MIVYQLEDAMKCGPKDRPRRRTKNNRSLKKCVGEQRNYQSKIEMISVLSFGKRLTLLRSSTTGYTDPLKVPHFHGRSHRSRLQRSSLLGYDLDSVGARMCLFPSTFIL